MARNIRQKQIADLGKGINVFTVARGTMIADNEVMDGWNCWSVGKNSISKRPGVVKLAEISGVSRIDGLGTYYDGSTRKLLAMAGGKLYDVSSGTPTAIAGNVAGTDDVFTSGKRTDFVQAGGKTFISNGYDDLRYFDGTKIYTQTNGVKGQFLIYYKSCLWICGNVDSANLTRLYRSGSDSKIGDFTYDSATNPLATSVYVSKDDGQTLKGFFKHQDYLYPVKERSLWRATVGTDAYQLISLQLVDPARGTSSHHSIDTVENDNFMFNEQGVFATGYEPNILDQLRTNIVSLRVDEKIKAIQKSRLDDVEGIFYDNHYYLSYTSGGGTYNDTMLVYDRQRLGWWEFQIANSSGNYIGASCFSEWKNTVGKTNLYFGSPTDGSIYYFDNTAKQDSGWTINSSLKSKQYALEKTYSQVKFFLKILIYVGAEPADITFNIYIDGKIVKTKSITIGNTGSAGIGIGAIGTPLIGVGGGTVSTSGTGGDFVDIPINKKGRDIQIQITDASGKKGWEINSFIFIYKPLNPIYQPNVI